MSYKKLTCIFGFMVVLYTALPQISVAQWSIGASYEIRQEEPKNGFGARIEREILQQLPLVNLSLRAHFSYFNDENNVSREGISFSQDITNYDYGLAAIGGISIGVLSPYIGLGLGASTLDVNRNDLPSGSPLDEDSKDSAIYWNGLVGAKVNLLPSVAPFAEYRLEDVGDYKNELRDIKDSNGRWVFGISIVF
ncbi:MAG: outer membrane beta-barrel protein [Balneolaceae bacterium]|jgi:opacity protein-like surface antigen